MMLGRQSVVTLAFLGALGAVPSSAEQAVQAALPPGKAVSIPAPDVLGSPVNYLVDDGTAENTIGVNNGATANQFFWFNRFDIDPTDLPLRVDQIQVFWAQIGPNPPVVGNAF